MVILDIFKFDLRILDGTWKQEDSWPANIVHRQVVFAGKKPVHVCVYRKTKRSEGFRKISWKQGVATAGGLTDANHSASVPKTKRRHQPIHKLITLALPRSSSSLSSTSIEARRSSKSLSIHESETGPPRHVGPESRRRCRSFSPSSVLRKHVTWALLIAPVDTPGGRVVHTPYLQTLDGPFSAVSKPIFPSKY